MRLLFVFFNSQVRTGGHRRYIELAEGLARIGHEVIFLKSDALSLSSQHSKILSLPFSHNNGSLLPFSIRCYGALRAKRKELGASLGRIDWIVIHGESHLFAGLFLKKLTGARLLFAFRSNAVMDEGMSILENRGKPFKQLAISLEILKFKGYEKLVGKRADLILFQSEFDRESYLSRVPRFRSKTAVIRGNISEPHFKTEYKDINASSHLRTLLFIGGVGERKGIRHLIEAVEMLKNENRDVKLIAVGGGSKLESRKEYIRDHGLEDAIVFMGRQSNPFPFFKDADLVVVPSLFDSYPDVVLEALHTGAPVIASRVGGIPDILCHDELLFEPANARAIADRIGEMIDQPSRYLEARRLCAERRKEFLFDWAEEHERLMRCD